MAYGAGDLLDTAKKYGKYVAPVATYGTEKAYNFLQNLHGATGDAPQINHDELSKFSTDVAGGTPMAFGGLTPDQTSPALAGLAGSYQDTINGITPSLALQALHEQTGNNIANAYGNAAGGVTGGSALLALRHAQDIASGLNQQATGQAAMARAQELNDARAGLGGLLSDQGKAQLTRQNLALEALRAPLDVEAKNKAAQAAVNGQALSTAGQLGAAYLGG